jgi:photosystem II stability/assembly factor-like uncharacterized protein
MRWPQNITSLLILAVLLALPIGLSAQMNWAQVATPSTIGFAPHTMDAADGIVVVGGNGLAVSLDKGLTWRNITPNIPNNTNFVGIAIYDRNIFAVQSGTSGIYITHDQGRTWRPLLYGSTVVSAFPLIFIDDPQKILCTTNGAFVYTNDGGNTFTTSATSFNPYQFKLAADGTVRLFSRTDQDVRTASSADTGRTWVQSTVLPYKDCFSIIADPVNPNVLCLINEDFYLQQHQCMIFRTADNGSTWDTTLTHAVTYLAGSSDRGCHDYFVGTVSDGVLRSTDQGQTWHGIGGPSVPPDYRNLVAADDSLLFAIDNNRAVWASRPASNTWKIKLRNNLFFSNTDNVTCDSIHTGMVIVYPGCSNASIEKAEIVGPDAQQYDFLDSADASFPDTIKVRFIASGVGTTQASLKIKLTDGSNYTFDISATTIAPELVMSPPVLMEDSLIFCEALLDTLRIASPCPMSISSIVLSGLDSASFVIQGPSTRSLPRDSEVIVICNPKRLGRLDAQLEIITQYGRKHFIPLRPTVKRIPLTVFFDTIWARDTLWQCQTGRDTIRIRSVCSVSTINLTLTDSSNYRIVGKRSISLPQDSIIIIEYSSNGKTDILSYLRFRSSSLDSVNVPLRRSFKRAPIILKGLAKILNDTFSFCKGVFDTVRFSSQCPHTISGIHFEGPDAAKFKIIGNKSIQLPSDSAIIIYCSTNQPGQLNADLVVESADKFDNRYRLQPVFITAPFKFKPAALFVGDSVGACVGAFDTVRLTSDCPLKIKNISVTGIDASSFLLISKAPLVLPNDSTIIVQCLPGPKGRRLAALQIELEDGRTYGISLSALIVEAPIKILPVTLFSKDTVSKCSFILDTVRLLAPCPFSLKSVSIQGNDASLFQIEGSIPTNLPRDSIIIVRFTPTKTGPVTAYLRIEAADGRIWTVPFSPQTVETQLYFSKTLLFEKDTILSCSSLRDSIVISADCPVTITSIQVTGNDATSFSLIGPTSRVMPQDSEIIVVCTPSKSGPLDALLQVLSADGRAWEMPLKIFAMQSPLLMSKNSLFDSDSAYMCSTITDTIKLSSLCPVDLIDVSFSGSDVGSFAANLSQVHITADTMLVVTCSPTHTGKLDALMQLRSSDGRTWDVLLSAFSTPSPLLVGQSKLFESDSFTVCEFRKDTLHLRTNCPLAINNISIAGQDQTSFSLQGIQNLSLPEDSLLIVDCSPLRSGQLDATLRLIASDGRSFNIPLQPNVIDKATISLNSIIDVTTDTIGGDIEVPITINRSIGEGQVEFSLHFDASRLEFKGVFDNTGLDKSTTSGAGFSRVITDVTGTTTLFARYSYFPTITDCTEILIDSITTSVGSASCLTNLTDHLTVSVCANGFCGRDAITNFLRYGQQVNLKVIPNPSSGKVVLHSDVPLKNISLEIIDAHGIVKKTFTDVELASSGITIETSELPSGVYEIRTINGLFKGSARLVLVK